MAYQGGWGYNSAVQYFLYLWQKGQVRDLLSYGNVLKCLYFCAFVSELLENVSVLTLLVQRYDLDPCLISGPVIKDGAN